MERRLSVLVFILLGVAWSGATASPGSTESSVVAAGQNSTAPDAGILSDMDKDFVIDAEVISVREGALAGLALQQSRNNDVKSYAKILVDDHAQALKNLLDLMKKHGLSQPTTLEETRAEALAMIKDLSGPAFDRGFINMMVAGHRVAVTKFRNETNSGQNKDIRDYANGLLPILQKDLDQAEDVQGKLAGVPR